MIPQPPLLIWTDCSWPHTSSIYTCLRFNETHSAHVGNLSNGVHISWSILLSSSVCDSVVNSLIYTRRAVLLNTLCTVNEPPVVCASGFSLTTSSASLIHLFLWDSYHLASQFTLQEMGLLNKMGVGKMAFTALVFFTDYLLSWQTPESHYMVSPQTVYSSRGLFILRIYYLPQNCCPGTEALTQR